MDKDWFNIPEFDEFKQNMILMQSTSIENNHLSSTLPNEVEAKTDLRKNEKNIDLADKIEIGKQGREVEIEIRKKEENVERIIEYVSDEEFEWLLQQEYGVQKKQVENVVNSREDEINVDMGTKNEEGSSSNDEFFKESDIDDDIGSDIKVMVHRRVDDLEHALLEVKKEKEIENEKEKLVMVNEKIVQLNKGKEIEVHVTDAINQNLPEKRKVTRSSWNFCPIDAYEGISHDCVSVDDLNDFSDDADSNTDFNDSHESSEEDEKTRKSPCKYLKFNKEMDGLDPQF